MNEILQNICTDNINARCVEDNLELNEGSNLTSCYNQHQINQDVQNQLGRTLLSISEIEQQLLQRIELLEGRVLANETILSNLYDLNIENWGITENCLTDDCNNTITTLGQLIQALVDDACKTEI